MFNLIIPCNEYTIISHKIDFTTLVKSGTWITTQSLSHVGDIISTTIDVSNFGFASADKYIVIALLKNLNGTNSWATNIFTSNRTSTSFTLNLINNHWASGVIGAGAQISWAVFRIDIN